jgi:multidrug efflux pump subunit AcrA (membrane-fusion protein)
VRKPAAASSASKVRRRWITRYFLPLGIFAAFASLFGWAARDSFLPAQSVTITPVIVTKAEIQQAGTPLFQAAGWIEPRPTAIVVPALAAGVVKELLVAEGQTVQEGQAIAKLIDTDAKLAVQQAEAALRLSEAEVRNVQAALTAAQISLANPNELRAALADAESLLAETGLALGNLPYLIESANSRRQLAADNLQRKERAGDAIARRVRDEARNELVTAENALAELRTRMPTLQSQHASLQKKREALSQQLLLMNEHKRAVATNDAALAAACARRDQAQLSLDLARLNLERMVIYALMSGRVLTVDARPGRRLVGMDPSSQQDASAVVSIYDPEKLQVRVDVRLEDIPQVKIGQPVTIQTAALAQPLTGEVLWITTRADVQKNTLQVKVAIHDPAEVITPEMLGQVTFIAPPTAVAVTVLEQQPLRLLVPRSLVDGAEASASIWLADSARGVARQQAIQLGRAGTDDLIEVTSGLTPTDKLIVNGRESLSDGARVRIIGEDKSLGVSAPVVAGRTPMAATANRAESVSK